MYDEFMVFGLKGMYRNLVGLIKDDGFKRVKRFALFFFF